MVVEEYILNVSILKEKILTLSVLEEKSIHEIGELIKEDDDFVVATSIAELEKQKKIKLVGFRNVYKEDGLKISLALYSLVLIDAE